MGVGDQCIYIHILYILCMPAQQLGACGSSIDVSISPSDVHLLRSILYVVELYNLAVKPLPSDVHLAQLPLSARFGRRYLQGGRAGL